MSTCRRVNRIDKSTLERTDPSYSVFLWIVKFSAVFLCSCFKSPKMANGEPGLEQDAS